MSIEDIENRKKILQEMIQKTEKELQEGKILECNDISKELEQERQKKLKQKIEELKEEIKFEEKKEFGIYAHEERQKIINEAYKRAEIDIERYEKEKQEEILQKQKEALGIKIKEEKLEELKQEKCRTMSDLIKKYKSLREKTTRDIAEYLSIAENTVYRNNQLNYWYVWQVAQLKNYLQIPDDEFLEVIVNEGE